MPVVRNASVKPTRNSVSLRMSSKFVNGQRCTNAAVKAEMLGGSGCSSSGVRQIRLLPFFVVTIFTFGLAGKFASKLVSAISILRCNSSTNCRALSGWPSAV